MAQQSSSIGITPSLNVDGQQYTLYPNLNDDNFALVQQVKDHAPMQAEINDVVDRRVQTTHLLFQNRQQRMDIAGLPPGVYFLRLIDGNGKAFTIKFIKE